MTLVKAGGQMSFLSFIVLFIIIVVIVTVITLFFNRKKVPNISTDNDVINIIKRGDMLTAIKAYRQLHGVGLKEAKMFVEKHKEEKDNG